MTRAAAGDRDEAQAAGDAQAARPRPADPDRPPCAICARPAEAVTRDHGALCAAHRRRAQRLRLGLSRLALDAPLHGRDLTPLELVIIAGDAFLEAEAEDDAAYARALNRFRNACARWMRAQGWRPPRAFEDAGGEDGAR